MPSKDRVVCPSACSLMDSGASKTLCRGVPKAGRVSGSSLRYPHQGKRLFWGAVHAARVCNAPGSTPKQNPSQHLLLSSLLAGSLPQRGLVLNHFGPAVTWRIEELLVIRDVLRRKWTPGPETISALHRSDEMQIALWCAGAAGSWATRLGLFDGILRPVFLFSSNIQASFLEFILNQDTV